MQEQAEQNRRTAHTAEKLVEADAQSRGEMIAAHASSQESLQEERANLDQQKSKLGELRGEIELDRRRAPVIAEAIHVVVRILVCLCPLTLAAYFLYSVNRTSAADEAHIVNEILIGELTSETLRLLPAPIPESLAVTDQRSTEPVEQTEIEPTF
ncbi:hypothetical protein [Mariniblastus fucicola]|nr:hypothetical protein [Mariniblastus fucicola]